MVQPYDYRINVAQPMNGAVSGIQNALQIAQGIDTAEVQKQHGLLYKAQTENAQMDIAAKQRAAEQAAAVQKDLSAVVGAPTSEGITSLILKYPHLSESFQRGLNAHTADQQKARIQEGTQVYAAILNNDTGTARKILDDTAAVLRDKGDRQQAEHYERMSKLIELNPAGAQTAVGMMLATAMGPDKFQQTFKELEDQRRTRTIEPALAEEAKGKASKATSDAATAAVTAKYAESNAAVDLTKKGWEITKIQEDIKIAKINAQIASAQLQINRETNTLKKQELEIQIDKMKEARDKTTREKVAGLERARDGIDNAVNQLDAVINDPNLPNVLGTIEGRLPALVFDSNADSIARIETVGSQIFLTQAKEFGSTAHLSEKEGDKLQASLQSLQRVQSPEAFLAHAREAQRLMLKARKNFETFYGGTPNPPDTPNAVTSDAVQRALDKHLPKPKPLLNP